MLGRLFRSLFGPDSGRKRQHPRTRRPRLEVLEDRLNPSPTGLIWLGAAGASWGTATNWDDNRLPTSTDTVIFDKANGANTNSRMDLGGVARFHIGKLILRNGYDKTITLRNEFWVDVLSMNATATIDGAQAFSITQEADGFFGVPVATVFGTSSWQQGTISTSSFSLYGDITHAATLELGSITDTIKLDTNFNIKDKYSTANWRSGDVTVVKAKTLTNNGTVLLDSAGNTFGNAGGVLDRWTFQNNNILTLKAGKLGNAIPKNAPGAKVAKAASATPGATNFEITNAFVLDTNATLEVDSGTLTIDGSLTQSAGTILVSAGTTLTAADASFSGGTDTVLGIMTSAAGASFSGGALTLLGTLAATGSVTQSGGTILVSAGGTLSGASASLSGGTFSLDTGTLQTIGDVDILSGGLLSGVGEVTTGGTLDDAGTLTIVGSGPSGLHVTGNYAQTGTLNVQISNSYAQGLHVTGLATLGGILNVTMMSGYSPPFTGASFEIVSYGSHSGSFATMNLPTLFWGTWQARFDDPAYPNAFSLWVI